MIELAQSGELELRILGETGLAMIVAHDSLRLTHFVEISDPAHGLSPRKLQIARLVANGATNQAIARDLDISTWTVSTHLRRIFAKLSVCTRAEIVAQLFATPHLLSGDQRTDGGYLQGREQGGGAVPDVVAGLLLLKIEDPSAAASSRFDQCVTPKPLQRRQRPAAGPPPRDRRTVISRALSPLTLL